MMRNTGLWHVAGRGEACEGLWCGDLKERENLQNPGVDGEDNIEMKLQDIGCGGYELFQAG
jgi:hypothetical protein